MLKLGEDNFTRGEFAIHVKLTKKLLHILFFIVRWPRKKVRSFIFAFCGGEVGGPFH